MMIVFVVAARSQITELQAANIERANAQESSELHSWRISFESFLCEIWQRTRKLDSVNRIPNYV